MFDFELYVPTKVVFGRGAEKRAGEMVKRAGGTKVLLHYGSVSAEKTGLLSRIEDSLKAEGVAYCKLGGVVPNPRLSKVREGVELSQKEGVDFILAVGGGSVIDSSKAIAYALADPDNDVWELFDGTRKKAAGCLPLGAVPTIAAAGSETSDSCVITNDLNDEKRGYNDDIARPRFALMNPELTMTLPAYQTASGCVDIMMHTFERYFTQGGNMELTDEIAEGLLRTVVRNALILRDDPEDYDARAEIMWAGSLSHNGLTGCGIKASDFASHKMEHELSGMFDVAHGAGLAAIWCSWARYVCADCTDRFAKYARNVLGVTEGKDDLETALKGIDETETFFKAIDMPVNLESLIGRKATDDECIALGKNCARACGGKKGAAKVLYEDDMIEIFRNANR